jgi:hypothetical protein
MYCKARSAYHLAYFYFSFQDTEKQKTLNLLRSILAQLVLQIEEIPDTVRVLYDNYQHNQPPTDRLLSAIKSLTGGPRHIFIIIDALDECPNGTTERSDLCAALNEIMGWKTTLNLHVLVTSRRETDLVEGLSPLCTINPICIQDEVVKSNVRKFVQAQLSNDSKLKKWSTEIQHEIEETLVEGAKGM